MIRLIFVLLLGKTGLPGHTGQTGQTSQRGHTVQTDLTFELDFLGNLLRAAFEILAMFAICFVFLYFVYFCISNAMTTSLVSWSKPLAGVIYLAATVNGSLNSAAASDLGLKSCTYNLCHSYITPLSLLYHSYILCHSYIIPEL